MYKSAPTQYPDVKESKIGGNMKDLRCKLDIHTYKRISKAVPTKEETEGFDFIIRSYALGECSRCSHLAMIECIGGLESYYLSEAKTKSEWLKVLGNEKH